jgi:hypothetical protein
VDQTDTAPTQSPEGSPNSVEFKKGRLNFKVHRAGPNDPVCYQQCYQCWLSCVSCNIVCMACIKSA